MTDKPRTYTTREVSSMTGATVRQLQWWHEKGIVCPEVRRHRRKYSDDHLVGLALILELLDHGISMKRIGQLEMSNQLGLTGINTAKNANVIAVADEYSCILSKESELTTLLKSSKRLVAVAWVSERLARFHMEHNNTRK